MQDTQGRSKRWGAAALFLGALSLILAFVLIYAGPFAPVQTLGVGIGEVAGEAIKSTVREVLNRPQPAAELRSWTIDDALEIGTVVLSVLTIVAVALSYTLERPNPIAHVALGLGASALLVLWLSWLALLVCGLLLVIYIVSFLSEGFGGFLSGLFGG